MYFQTVGYLGLPPYIVHDPATNAFGGADLRLLGVVSEYFGLVQSIPIIISYIRNKPNSLVVIQFYSY